MDPVFSRWLDPDPGQLNPIIQPWSLFIKHSRDRGIDLYAFHVVRTRIRFAKLFVKGCGGFSFLVVTSSLDHG